MGDSPLPETKWLILIGCLAFSVVGLAILLIISASLVVPILEREAHYNSMKIVDSTSSEESLRRRPQQTILQSYQQPRFAEPIEPKCFQPPDWKTGACCPNRMCHKNWKKNAVLLISMDGFRADYLKQNKTSALQKLIDCGSHAPFMYPSYPSITFPNHYALVTGLYPESHGIVGNHMFDPTIVPESDQKFDRGQPGSYNPRWWGGEPLWNTVMKNGMKAATYFWPGSEIPIQNMRPDYWLKFESKKPFSQRVDQVIYWLTLPENERPSFVTLYFQEPDHNGHVYGPFSPEVSNQLLLVDSTIDYLMQQLFDNGILDCVNILFVADHGMQKVYKMPWTKIYLEQYFDVSRTISFDGPVGRIMLGNNGISKSDVINAMRCKNDSFRVYAREDVPKRLHLSRNPRIGDVVVDSNPGYEVLHSTTQTDLRNGEHGYDFRFNAMHAIFIANGPNIKQEVTVEPFENVEIFNLMADLLGITETPPNNGTKGSLRSLIKDFSVPYLQQVPNVAPMPPCQLDNYELVACSMCDPYETTLNLREPCPLGAGTPIIATLTNPDPNTCQLMGCSTPLIYDFESNIPRIEQSVIYGDTVLDIGDKINCAFTLNSISDCNVHRNVQRRLSQNRMALRPLLTSNNNTMQLYYQKMPMYTQFYSMIWKPLQELGRTYSRRFGPMILAAGPIFDYDSDGLADSADSLQSIFGNQLPIPSHYFLVMVQCETGWNFGQRKGYLCTQQQYVRVLSFIIPHKQQPDNCQGLMDYFYSNTGRIRDIELLTGLKFFEERVFWGPEMAMKLRIHVNQRLWDRF